MFIETMKVQQPGWDLAIIGDSLPPFELPSNVQHVHIPFEEMVDLLVDNVFNETSRPSQWKLKQLFKGGQGPKKVVDWKPLMGYLFPKVFEGYQWWGHMDNDLILGNLTKLFPQSDLQYYDTISGAREKKHLSWGPFMMYRNLPVLNELFKKAGHPDGFVEPTIYMFDEWALRAKAKGWSMTHMLRNHAEELGIRPWNTDSIMLLDKHECPGSPKRYPDKEDLHNTTFPKQDCAGCAFRPHSEKVLVRTYDQQEVFLCHYQNSKRLYYDDSLNNTEKFQGLLERGEFHVNFTHGFDFLENAPPVS